MYYARDLFLVRVGRDRTMSAWIEDNRKQPLIALRLVHDNGQLGPVGRIPPVLGFPTAVRFLPPDRAVWIEFVGAIGRLVWARYDASADYPATAEMVQGLADVDVDAVACCVGPDGTHWFLVESRAPDSRLLLGRWTSGSGGVAVCVLRKDAFFVRPRLVAGSDTVMAAWDEYADGRYRIRTLDTGHAASTGELLPVPEHHWETLGALAQNSEGVWFAARCRERLVELEGGVAAYHSELVVAVRGTDGWADVASIDIDHGLNPWMAGYAGDRRFPSLAAGDDSVVLLWEEKEDPRTMDPAPGRFCAASIGPDGLRTPPWTAVAGVSHLIAEHEARADGAWLASKTQTYHNEQHLPWCLHRFQSGDVQQQRPADIESNRAAPFFRVRSMQPSRPAFRDQSLRLFFGDLHLHSRLSGDLDGEQDELYHFARDIAELDFCAFCENDAHRLIEPMTAATWEQNRRNAEFFDEPGRFSTLLGWEYTKHAEPEQNDPIPNSHRCVLFEGSEGEVWHYWDDGVRTPSPSNLCARFRGRRVLLHHHHAQGFDITDDTLERNIEVCSGWAVVMMNSKFRDALHELLRRGFKLGFFGSSDNHERNPGLGGALVGVWACENTRAAIFDALWHRRVFATTGIRPDIRFRVSGAFMGESTQVGSDPPFVELTVASDVPLEQIEIVRDGETVHVEEPLGGTVTCQWPDRDCPTGTHFYYAHVQFKGSEYNPYWNIANAYGVNVWTSPVWVIRC